MATIAETQETLRARQEQIQQQKGLVEKYKSTIPRTTQQQLRGQVGRNTQVNPLKALLTRKRYTQARQKAKGATQQLTQAEQELQQYEQQFENYLRTEGGKLQYAKEKGLKPSKYIYRRYARGYAQKAIPVYSTPYGEVVDEQMWAEYARAQARAQAKALGFKNTADMRESLEMAKALGGNVFTTSSGTKIPVNKAGQESLTQQLQADIEAGKDLEQLEKTYLVDLSKLKGRPTSIQEKQANENILQDFTSVESEIKDYKSPITGMSMFSLVSAQPTTREGQPWSISKAPSWIERTADLFNWNLGKSGNVVQAGLKTIGATAQTQYDKYTQDTGDYYQYEGTQNLLGLAPNLAYFTPAGPSLLLGGAVSKGVAYTIKPEILESKGAELSAFTGENLGFEIPKPVSTGLVLGYDIGEGVLGGLGVSSQIKNLRASWTKPQTRFYAEVTPTKSGSRVDVLSSTEGYGINPNVARSRQFLANNPIDDTQSLVFGKTYAFDKADDIIDLTKSYQAGRLKQGSSGGVWNKIDDFYVGRPSDTTLRGSTGSRDVWRLRYDESKFNWIDDIVPQRVPVSGKTDGSGDIGVIYPRDKTITGDTFLFGSGDDIARVTSFSEVPDEFIYFGSSNPKIRIYPKEGRVALAGEKDVTGLIRIKGSQEEGFDIGKIFIRDTSSGSLKLRKEIQSAIGSVTKPKQTPVVKDVLKTPSLDLGTPTTTTTIETYRSPITGGSFYAGTGQYESTTEQGFRDPLVQEFRQTGDLVRSGVRVDTLGRLGMLNLNRQAIRTDNALRLDQSLRLDSGLRMDQALRVKQVTRQRQPTRQKIAVRTVQTQKIDQALKVTPRPVVPRPRTPSRGKPRPPKPIKFGVPRLEDRKKKRKVVSGRRPPTEDFIGITKRFGKEVIVGVGRTPEEAGA